jgi:hypothetical protein
MYHSFFIQGLHGRLDVHKNALKLIRKNLHAQKLRWIERAPNDNYSEIVGVYSY